MDIERTLENDIVIGTIMWNVTRRNIERARPTYKSRSQRFSNVTKRKWRLSRITKSRCIRESLARFASPRVSELGAKNNAAFASNFEWRRWNEGLRRGAASFRGRVCVLEEIYSGTRKASRRGAVLRYVEPVGMRKYTSSTPTGTLYIFALATLILEGAVTTFRCRYVTFQLRETLQTGSQ